MSISLNLYFLAQIFEYCINDTISTTFIISSCNADDIIFNYIGFNYNNLIVLFYITIILIILL